jgi:hypothetical protein
MTAPEKRKSLDWEAIERDYRVDTFTLRELASKPAYFVDLGEARP